MKNSNKASVKLLNNIKEEQYQRMFIYLFIINGCKTTQN